MFLEVLLAGSFLGLCGLLLWLVLSFIPNKNEEAANLNPASPWIALLILIGFWFFWGLFQAAYYSSFEPTVITDSSGDDTLVKDNLWFLATALQPLVSAFLWIGSGLCVTRFIWFLAYTSYNQAKNSRV